MKRSVAAGFILLCLSLSVSGQWYNKTYGVTDINSLSLDQLQESLKKSNTEILISLGAIGVGALVILLEKVQPYEVNDDSPLFDQIMGSNGMHYMTIGLGTLIAAYGVTGTFAYIGRSAVIKSTIRKNFPVEGKLNISPAVLFNSYTRGYAPGISLSVRF